MSRADPAPPPAAANAHGTAHAHGAGFSRRDGSRRLAVALGLVLGFMLVELVAGWITGSLALLADAGHMLADAGALSLSLFASWIARKPPDPKRTFGYYRTEILAALANGSALVAMATWVVVAAIGRLSDPPSVDGATVSVVAAGGLLVNLACLAILRGGHGHSLNERGAWLHVWSDLLGSLQALAAGALIWVCDWRWADPVASLLIGLLVARSAWRLVKEAVAVLMEGTPAHIDVDRVRDALVELDGVLAVHDLHVWSITSGLESVSAHVVFRDRAHDELLSEIRDRLHERFGIDHITIQLETEEFEERAAPV